MDNGFDPNDPGLLVGHPETQQSGAQGANGSGLLAPAAQDSSPSPIGFDPNDPGLLVGHPETKQSGAQGGGESPGVLSDDLKSAGQALWNVPADVLNSPTTLYNLGREMGGWLARKVGTTTGLLTPEEAARINPSTLPYLFTPPGEQYQPKTESGRLLKSSLEAAGNAVAFNPTGGVTKMLGTAVTQGIIPGAAAQAAEDIAPGSPVAAPLAAIAAGVGVSGGKSLLNSNYMRNLTRLGDPEGRAISAMASAIPNPEEVASVMKASPQTPLTIADFAAPGSTRLFRAAIDNPSQESKAAAQFLSERDVGVDPDNPLFGMFKQSGAVDRVTQAVKDAFGSDDMFKTQEQLLAQRLVDSEPLYAVFNAEPPTPIESLYPFMRSPDFASAVTRANNAVLAEGGEPLSTYFDNSGGELALKQAIPPDVLNRVKQGLDDNWLAAKNSGDMGAARTANTLRQRFVDFLDAK